MKVKVGHVVAIAMIGLILALSACDKAVGTNELDQAMGVAKTNAKFTAQRWMQENPTYADFEIMARGDSSQMAKCPQGDGWATVDLLNAKTRATEKQLKCSTWSANRGCWDAKEFKTKPFAAQDGSCQSTTDVPYPLPSLTTAR